MLDSMKIIKSKMMHTSLFTVVGLSRILASFFIVTIEFWLELFKALELAFDEASKPMLTFTSGACSFTSSSDEIKSFEDIFLFIPPPSLF